MAFYRETGGQHSGYQRRAAALRLFPDGDFTGGRLYRNLSSIGASDRDGNCNDQRRYPCREGFYS